MNIHLPSVLLGVGIAILIPILLASISALIHFIVRKDLYLPNCLDCGKGLNTDESKSKFAFVEEVLFYSRLLSHKIYTLTPKHRKFAKDRLILRIRVNETIFKSGGQYRTDLHEYAVKNKLTEI